MIGFGDAFLIAWVVIARVNSWRGDNIAFAREIVLAASIGGLVGSKILDTVFIGHGPIVSRGGHPFWGGLIGGASARIGLIPAAYDEKAEDRKAVGQRTLASHERRLARNSDGTAGHRR